MADTKTRDMTSERRADQAREIVRDTVQSLNEATGEVEARLGTAANAAESGVRSTSEALRRRSDATLAMLGAFSIGLTTGFLLGGAHRLMTLASLVPAALIGGVILERVDRPRRDQARTGADGTP